MQTTRWDEGDPRRLFPGLDDPSVLLPPLRGAAEALRAFAERFDGAWQLTWDEVPLGPSALSGYAEGPGPWCEAELWAPRDPVEWTPLPGPPWELGVRVCVRCAEPDDCGAHYVHELDERTFDDPVAAVTALGAGVRWALERVLAEPPEAWVRHARH
ncbi:hypothetical protein [Kitasatospora phosalacinea]|uniref:Uncharacterized protein n=1 Tax=Kitasatospora phosalacinea TaxID=2065 RepID=A0A9W6PHQ6_9ACTN|nr:hypothetical protein [Kitasatospora phosalacinea]GLW55255.1 hypothetical protein Kpho01_32660 [Kitasatospora phosalacinea]